MLSVLLLPMYTGPGENARDDERRQRVGLAFNVRVKNSRARKAVRARRLSSKKRGACSVCIERVVDGRL